MLPSLNALSPRLPCEHIRLPIRLPDPISTDGCQPDSTSTNNRSSFGFEPIFLMLTSDPQKLIRLRSFITYLELCKVTDAWFDCRDAKVWRNLLDYAYRTTEVPSKYDGLLLTPAQVDNENEDQNTATRYRQAFRDYVIFRSLQGHTAYKDKNDFISDDSFDLTWFRAQIDIFLSRTNGSVTTVMHQMRISINALRRDHPDYPNIPADFFVSAIHMVKRMRCSAGNRITPQRLGQLIAKIQKKEYY